MRHALTLWALFFLSSFTSAQVLPTSNGSCGVSASGIMSCSWLSAAPLSKADKDTNKTEPQGHSELFVTRFTLSPGTPLSSLVEGHEVLIVGMGDGELVNEAKSPPTSINVWNGSVFLMPKEDHYLLRNVGKQDVQLLVLDVRR